METFLETWDYFLFLGKPLCLAFIYAFNNNNKKNFLRVYYVLHAVQALRILKEKTKPKMHSFKELVLYAGNKKGRG